MVNRALALDVGRSRLETDHVLLRKLKLGGILDGDDAFVGGNIGRQHVQQSGFPGAGAPGDDDVLARQDRRLEELRHLET